jgi:hypothetical protein
MFVFVKSINLQSFQQLFDYSNCIDSHNHVHQFELALEKRWFTHGILFCLHTTLAGMTVPDVWRLYQYHKLITSKKDKDGKNMLIIKQFTGVLAKKLIKIAMSCENEAFFLGSPTTASRSSSISTLSSEQSTDYYGRAEYTNAEGRQKKWKNHHRQRHCQWCKVKNGELLCTIWTCHLCQALLHANRQQRRP